MLYMNYECIAYSCEIVELVNGDAYSWYVVELINGDAYSWHVIVEQSVVLPVFGLGLKEHLEHSGRQIAVVIEECIMALYSPDYNALSEEVYKTIDNIFIILLSFRLLIDQYSSGRPNADIWKTLTLDDIKNTFALSNLKLHNYSAIAS